ncbi:MAG: S46 family peptidase [Bacteroidales bacterium]|nr:S46 family peptidase [Bacteroidales bacterium]
MKKNILLFLIILMFQFSLKANEGMWIPLLLEQLNETEMRDMGLKLSAEDIYSVNHSSLKDAIVIFGGGCTAELVSDQGLLFTNHHCGYSYIQSHSSVEHDYLTDGFWAMSKNEELACPGLTVTFLNSMKDVTEQVLKNVKDNMCEDVRDSLIKVNIKNIEKQSVEGTNFNAKIKPFFYGNKYYLFITEVYKDIRLVGTPPSDIGKFGGDTDNWMWPRHTGDFSVFRIYADKNNKPANYSKNNKPYKPKKFFPVSIKGVNEDDFTFVFGYPGTTKEYVPSYEVKMVTQIENPVRIELRKKRLDIMSNVMNKSAADRIKYSAKYARVANFWKKMIGQNKGIKDYDAIAKKQNSENNFTKWANTESIKKYKYYNLLPEFKKVYDKLTPLNLAFVYFYEAGLGVEIVRYAYRYNNLYKLCMAENSKQEDIDKEIQNLKKLNISYFKNYNPNIDKAVFSSVLQMYFNNLSVEYHPEIFKMVRKKFQGNFSKYADFVFDKSFMTSKDKADKFLDNFKKSKIKKIKKNPAFALSTSIYNVYFNNIKSNINVLNNNLDSLKRVYMKALMQMHPDKKFYPEANFTLRVTYGKVKGYSPKDAVKYDYFTTLKGIIEKENPNIYDYVVEDKLKELYLNKDYGRYADKDGTMHVCFTASNHTTGGNSGSPVINAEGQLVGINFDRNWEGTMSDFMFNPDQCRNISLDIRYCLFIIDKFAGAKNIIDELNIIE